MGSIHTEKMAVVAANGMGKLGVKITDLITGALNDESTKKPLIAFEYYPPKTSGGVNTLYKRADNQRRQQPLYIDVTWGAGGSTSDLTLELCCELKKKGLEPNMHLTCTNMVTEKIRKGLEGAKEAGIRNIVALRGGTLLHF